MPMRPDLRARLQELEDRVGGEDNRIQGAVAALARFATLWPNTFAAFVEYEERETAKL